MARYARTSDQVKELNKELKGMGENAIFAKYGKDSPELATKLWEFKQKGIHMMHTNNFSDAVAELPELGKLSVTELAEKTDNYQKDREALAQEIAEARTAPAEAKVDAKAEAKE